MPCGLFGILFWGGVSLGQCPTPKLFLYYTQVHAVLLWCVTRVKMGGRSLVGCKGVSLRRRSSLDAGSMVLCSCLIFVVVLAC